MRILLVLFDLLVGLIVFGKDHKRTFNLLINRLQTKKLLQDFKSNFNAGYLSEAEKIANLLPKPYQVKSIEKIIKRYIKKGWGWFNEAQNTANLSLKEPLRTRWLEKILKKCISKGSLNKAQEIANLLKRELTKEELEKILKKNIKGGWLTEAKETVRLLKRELKREEILKIYDIQNKSRFRFKEIKETVGFLIEKFSG